MEQPSPYSMQELMQLANSPAGQQLLALLRNKDSAQLQQIIRSATSGDYQNAKNKLESMLDSPEAKKLLQNLEGR